MRETSAHVRSASKRITSPSSRRPLRWFQNRSRVSGAAAVLFKGFD